MSGKANQINLERMIKARDRNYLCPVCCDFLRYLKLSGSIASWAPSPYAWICLRCPVVMHDGSIIPGERTWFSSIQSEEIRKINKYLVKVLAWHRATQQDVAAEGTKHYG